MKKPDLVFLTLGILGIINLAATAFVFPFLPEIIPVHWGVSGEIDGWAVKAWTFLTASLPLLFTILAVFLPRIDPKRENYAKHWGVYRLIIALVVLFLIGLQLLTVLVSFKLWQADVSSIIPASLGILFLIMGNYLPRIRHNYTLGIKLPWTLANETVWNKTHRLGGQLMVILGVVILLSVFLLPWVRVVLIVTGLVLFLTVTSVYSYIIFQQETAGKPVN